MTGLYVAGVKPEYHESGMVSMFILICSAFVYLVRDMRERR